MDNYTVLSQQEINEAINKLNSTIKQKSKGNRRHTLCQTILKKKYEATRHYNTQIWYDDIEYIWFSTTDGLHYTHIPTYAYKKQYISGRKGTAKQLTNKKVRHTKIIPNRPAGYRMIFDYDWCVW